MTTVAATPATTAGERAPWRAVAVPAEHGGWGLTAEPILLGLLVARSWAGVALGIAAAGTFLVRTPLKLAVIDARRHHWRARSALAARIAAVELLLVVGAAGAAVALAGTRWTWAVVAALPLVAVQLAFDVRSRGRRLVPEVAGAAGMAAVAGAIAVAGGRSWSLGAALWLVLAARSVGAMPFVRGQIARVRRGATSRVGSDAAQVLAVAIAAVAVVLDHRVLAGAVGVAAVGALHVWWARRPVVPPKTLGLRQMALGLAVVAATAIGVLV